MLSCFPPRDGYYLIDRTAHVNHYFCYINKVSMGNRGKF